MVTRQAIIVSGIANKGKKLRTAATTLGELKAEAPEYFTGDVEVIVRPGNVTLRDDGSLLPDGDFKVYVIVTKNKAGLDEYEIEEFVEEVSEILHGALNAKFAEVKAAVLGSLSQYKSDDEVEEETTSDVDPELAEALREAKELSGR